MTQRQRYSDNRYLIEKYRHYLSRFHELDAVKGKNDWMINEADQIDQENLIREMSRLLEINETSVVYRDNINTIKINRVNLEYYHAVLGLTETMKGTCEVMEKKF